MAEGKRYRRSSAAGGLAVGPVFVKTLFGHTSNIVTTYPTIDLAKIGATGVINQKLTGFKYVFAEGGWVWLMLSGIKETQEDACEVVKVHMIKLSHIDVTNGYPKLSTGCVNGSPIWQVNYSLDMANDSPSTFNEVAYGHTAIDPNSSTNVDTVGFWYSGSDWVWKMVSDAPGTDIVHACGFGFGHKIDLKDIEPGYPQPKDFCSGTQNLRWQVNSTK